MRRNSLRSRRFTVTAAILAAAVVLVSFAACKQLTPAEKVSKLRSEYSAELNSFTIRETPMTGAMGEEGMMDEGMEGEAMGDEAVGDQMDEGMDAMAMDVPTRKDAVLDIVLRKEGGTDRLPGITVDIYQVGPDEQQKATYRVYVDTSRLNPGSRKAVSDVLEDVDYSEGDGFAVEIRGAVPPEMYPEYQEYADLDAGDAG